ncbi:MAG: O-antigen ligase family protein [Candidatus Omnitrophica bacterium]|jgi:O-antigen ligase|nr:O-antigen ligase family protein [Candidatus Omnitrophota bacterium]
MEQQKLINFADRFLLVALCLFLVLAPFLKIAVKVILGLSVAVLFVASFLKYKYAYNKGLLHVSPVLKAILIFLGAAILSTLFSALPKHSYGILMDRYIPYVLFFILGLVVVKNNIRNFFIICTIVVSLNIVIGIGGMKDYLAFHPERLFTAFKMDVTLTNFLIIFAPLCACGAILAGARLWHVLNFVGLIFILPVFVWVGSRSTWFSVAVAVFTVLLLKKTRRLFLWALLLIFAVILMPTFFQNRLHNTFNTNTWGDRMLLYQTAGKIFLHYPLLGSGTGTFEKLLYEFGPVGGYPEGRIHLHAHNTFLEVLSEMGIIGFFAFCGIFFCFFRMVSKFKALWQGDSVPGQGMILGGIAGIVAVLIFANASTLIIVGMRDAPVFWFFLGAISGLCDQKIVN